jgi:hypothetical protein
MCLGCVVLAVILAVMCLLRDDAFADTTPETPPFAYVEVGADRGMGDYAMQHGTQSNVGGGIAAADFDDDGDVDVFVPTANGTPDQLYRNLGNGRFDEIAADAGVASMAGNRCALWFDYDGDGHLDLIVGNDEQAEPSTYRLYRQIDTARFEDVTELAGLFVYIDGHPGSFHVNRGGMCAGDINNDGHLDLYSPLWNGRSHLFLNDGAGKFTDISETSGVGVQSTAYQGLMVDVDRDGLLDIYVSLDAGPNLLWLNQGNLTFIESARGIGGMANNKNDMGMAVGDFDNDRDLDFYVTGLWSTAGELVVRHNVLIRNDTNEVDGLSFREISKDVGVAYGGFGWGATFTDGDGDGWLDIVATNGFWGSNNPDPSLFYWNRPASGSFADASDAVAFNDQLYGSGVVAFDYDRDGDEDLVQTLEGELRLLENRRHDGADAVRFLVVRPRMAGANRFAIGAIVRIRTNTNEMMRPIAAGTSFFGQEPAEAHFGLGAATAIESVTVEWPGGGETVLDDVATDQVLTVFDDGTGAVSGEQLPGDGTQDGLVDISDALSLLSGLFLGTMGSFPCGGESTTDPAGNRTLLDWSGDDLVEISDALGMLFHLFLGGPAHSRSVVSADGTGCLPILGCPHGCRE